jgi:hypothetical protein
MQCAQIVCLGASYDSCTKHLLLSLHICDRLTFITAVECVLSEGQAESSLLDCVTTSLE